MSNIEPLTRQQVFEKALIGIRQQGYRQSLKDSSQCAYNGLDGTHCAVGHCLTDSIKEKINQDPDLNGMPFMKFQSCVSEVNELFKGIHYTFLTDLQAIHDYKAREAYDDSSDRLDRGRFEGLMETFAKDHNLTYTPPQTL